MILFKEDWNKYPSAIPDVQTPNKSFLKYCALLKSAGVRNYMWPLALKNPSLVGVDPFAKDLTMAQKTAIIAECKYNRTYFFREIFRLPAAGGNKPNPFRAHRGNMGLLWSLSNNMTYALVAPRQVGGKSVGADGFMTHVVNYGPKDNSLFLITKDDQLRAVNVKRLNDIREKIPRWLCPIAPDELDNTKTVSCKTRNTVLMVGVGQASEDGAFKLGRGLTVPFIQIDEMPFVKNCHIIVPAALGATTMARRNAKEAGMPYGTLVTTTAGSLDTPEGRYAHEFIHGGVFCSEKNLFDLKDNADLFDYVNKNKKGNRLIINGTFNHRQLGVTDKQFLAEINEAGGSEAAMAMDFFNKWDHGSLTSPVDPKILGVIHDNVVEPKHSITNDTNYTLDWYVPYAEIDSTMDGNPVVISLDTGNMLGRDANGMTITNMRTAGVIATSAITEGLIHVYANWIAGLLIRYSTTTLIIENKSSGQSMLDVIVVKLIEAGINPFERIFNNVFENQHTDRTAYMEVKGSHIDQWLQLYTRYKGKFGFSTNGSNRNFLYDKLLTESSRSAGHLIKDNAISAQMGALIMKNGRVDHKAGEHDDAVISWLFGQWFIRYCQNLKDYGIRPADCLSLASSHGAVLSPEELENLSKRKIVLVEIEGIKQELKTASSPIAISQLERVLTNKVRQAESLGDRELNLSAILEEVNEQRTTQVNLRDRVRQHQRQQHGHRPNLF